MDSKGTKRTIDESKVGVALSAYTSSFEKEYFNLVDSSSAKEAVQNKLNSLSKKSFKQFLKDPKTKFSGTPPHSANREKCVENVVVEICSNIKYHFQKAVGSHKIRLFDFWKNNDPNFNNELGLKMLEDAQSTIFPYVIKTFLSDFINGKTGDDENQLYQYIEAKTSVVVAPFFIWPPSNLKSPSTNPVEIHNIGRLELPQELTKPLCLTSIPKFDTETSDSLLKDTVDLLITILKPIMIPFTIPDLRFVRVWRGINVRIMNYAITLVTYGRYIDHPDFPDALKYSVQSGAMFPPPYWVLIEFFKSSGLPYNCSGKKEITGETRDDMHTCAMKEKLRNSIQTDYKKLHYMLLGIIGGVWHLTENNSKNNSSKKVPKTKVTIESSSNNSSSSKFELEPMNCIVTSDTKRPPLFNDLQDWVYKYRYRYTVGVYDEYPFINRKPNQALDVEFYKKLAEDGLHCTEIAIMETVLRSDIHTKPPPKSNK